ncbi:ABC transporter transmembrane domain-containing protein [uncultured Enterovirga sp.]|uniref:ABC transporter transmembrane domain-containing protein n=1 Tax=uncultured Enterovirga sp. TaxID=2026352 RepID=UPI0035CAA44E
MNKSLFRYIWRHSKRDQLLIFAVVIASLPLYYISLDLPRKIVNEAIQGRAFENGQMTATFLDLSISWPKWLGGGSTDIVPGFQVGRLELLYGLSTLFLFFVLVNGFIKYWINVAKGALGERMMRRLRFELFASSLRFTPEALKNVRSAEAATIIKDEVEPIGGFIGDAYIQPMMLGTQAATALIFILVQSIWLGLLAGAVVGVQFLIIPRMRRELLRLGRLRQIASRRFAGRVSEVIDGMEAVQVHDTGTWERAEIGGRLHELFDIRFKIYKRKFIVKFLNNLLAQMTPFFFYAVGGYFALSGKLDIGQLVAVIAAYRELPPPLKELIDWDQQRLDVQVKYDQVVAYFSPERLVSGDDEEADSPDEPIMGAVEVSGLEVLEAHGTPIIAGSSFALTLPTRLGILSDGSAAAGLLARILARRGDDHSGEIKLNGTDYQALPRAVVGRRIAYAGTDAVLFPGTLRDNMLYGLRQRQISPVEPDEAERLRISEASRTGNPTETISADWVDLERSGYKDVAELDEALIDLLKRLGLEEDVYRYGLSGMIDPERQPALAERIVEARERLHAKLQDEGKADLVERFDPACYNIQATLVENLLFGVPTAKGLTGRAIVEDDAFRSVLDEAKLTDDLVAMGANIAETMTDIFRGLPSGHPLFDQFSFVHADELGEFEEIVKRSRVKGRGGLTRDDRLRLLALPLAYVEPRHRLGLLDDAMRARLLEARGALREALEKREEPGVEFYDPERVNTAAPVRDNLLFGRVNDSVAAAREQVREMGARVVQEMELSTEIERVGLDHQVGPAGRLLSPTQRASVNLIRCVVKRPDLLVVDGAFAPFGEKRIESLIRFLAEATEGRTLVVVLPNDHHVALFEKVIRFEDRRAILEDAPASPVLDDPDEVVEATPDEVAARENEGDEAAPGAGDDTIPGAEAEAEAAASDAPNPDRAEADPARIPTKIAAE